MLFGWIGSWSPGLGDPTPVGWLTVLAYATTAWLCFRAMKSEKRGPDRPYREQIPAVFRVLKKHWPNPPRPARRAAVWVLMGFIFAFLAANKQLDLQSAVTEIGRLAADAQGWYEHRRYVQMGFIAVVAVLGLIGMAGFVWLARGLGPEFRLPLSGLAFVVTFVVIRAASFHHFDRFIGANIVGIKMNWLLELTGIGIVAVSAYRRLRTQS